MKKSLFIAAAALMCACGGNKNQYVIEGNFEGLTANTVYLFDEQDNVLDSATVENGAFRFKGIAEAPAVRYLADAQGEVPASFSAMLFLEPGTILVANDSENALLTSVTGTPSNDANKAYKAAANALVKEYRDSLTTDERREAIEEEHTAMTRKSVGENHANLFGAMLLAQQLGYELSGQELLDQIALFTPEIQQTEVLTKLKTNAEQKLKSQIGQPYMDIVQNNAEGQPVSLKSVIENPANKLTLVDFWASWCGPCMGEIPYLIKDYKTYHDKGFEIYGVSFDKDRAKWLAAIADNGMNWIHVSDLNHFDNQAAKDYAIQGIPSNFLIDAQGKIVATNLRGEALGEKLKELLGE